ncbi:MULTISPECIES: hypothetical protein [unclassified Paenibacillus]|uniref:hypothetical protein n=1 Tax=unclassified Paenibacillus TaxID=185978 RepID=UPI002404D5B8|nr:MULTISPECIES: hypothetical protein [unclassified Paenibacillus]MDF9840754.1 hypothetical protein [Paenibacillus sp. PastF-2]MDF9847337.1 hypothetical protein [Paenibacillus sp. PastM-2]MDF9854085.1 hypothetical protein [Paenibacillus sp. PastF-1]MDH6479358.1 hypothetical protein [Paenibacillus sp. PastH-2]MDH6506909.1 hypothetical protein [Paenibacillus sp. PastM-3]
MEMSENAFVITVYVLLAWFIIVNLLLAGYSLRDWIKATFRQPKPAQKNHQNK